MLSVRTGKRERETQKRAAFVSRKKPDFTAAAADAATAAMHDYVQ